MASATTSTNKPHCSPYLQCPVETCSIEMFDMPELIQHMSESHHDFLKRLGRRRKRGAGVGAPEVLPRATDSVLRETMRSDVMTDMETYVGHGVLHLDRAIAGFGGKRSGGTAQAFIELNQLRNLLLKMNQAVLALRGRAKIILVPRRKGPRPTTTPLSKTVGSPFLTPDNPVTERSRINPAEIPEGIKITPI